MTTNAESDRKSTVAVLTGDDPVNVMLTAGQQEQLKEVLNDGE